MRITKRLAAVAVALLLPAGVALAAGLPVSGTYTGSINWNNPGSGAQTFDITATLAKGKLTAIQGTGDPGFIPYNPKLSNASAGCGDANSFDSTTSGWSKPSGHVNKKGKFTFVAKDSYHSVVTLKGRFESTSSPTTAHATFRFFQSHLPKFNKSTGTVTSTGHCDSGKLKVTLTKS